MSLRKLLLTVSVSALAVSMAVPGVVLADNEETWYDRDTHTLVLAGDVDHNTISQALSGVNEAVSVRVSSEGAYIADPYKLFWRSAQEHYSFVDIDLTGAVLNANKSSAYGMFMSCKELVRVDLGDIDTGYLTDISNMFYECESLTDIDLGEYFDTSSVTDMRMMFKGCTNLQTIDLGEFFDTSAVVHINTMFADCTSLKKIDLGDKFVTDNVKSMSFMFYNCSSLEEIKVHRDWSLQSVENDNLMSEVFTGCTKLKGGCGTVYDADKVSGKYAHVDGGSSNPGYLTSAVANIIAGYKIKLDGTVGVDFYFSVTGSFMDNYGAHLKISVPGASDRTVSARDFGEPVSVEGYEGSFYVTELSLAAKQMRDKVTISFYADSAEKEKVAEYDFTVEDYARAIINGNYEVNVKGFVKSMMTYGIYSEEFFGYGDGTSKVADDWANDINNIENFDGIDLERLNAEMRTLGYDSYICDSLGGTGISLAGSSLVLKSTVKLKLYFKSQEEIKATLGGADLPVKHSGGYYIVTIEGITAENLCNRYELVINGHKIYVFPITYCYRVLNDTSDSVNSSLKKLVIAMYQYNKRAEAL